MGVPFGHMGTPQMLIDQNRNVVWKADYDEFGKAEILVEQVEFNHRLPGQYYDKETGLNYNYYRDYDSNWGRYVQSDPIGLGGGINTYGYVAGNPLIYSDPTGLAPDMSYGFGGGFGVPSPIGRIGVGGSISVEQRDCCKDGKKYREFWVIARGGPAFGAFVRSSSGPLVQFPSGSGLPVCSKPNTPSVTVQAGPVVFDGLSSVGITAGLGGGGTVNLWHKEWFWYSKEM